LAWIPIAHDLIADLQRGFEQLHNPMGGRCLAEYAMILEPAKCHQTNFGSHSIAAEKARAHLLRECVAQPRLFRKTSLFSNKDSCVPKGGSEEVLESSPSYAGKDPLSRIGQVPRLNTIAVKH
jgi:hypothetical protein